MQIRHLLILILFISQGVFSQSNYNDCWECIIASENDSTSITIEECSRYAKNNGASESGQIASFILASAYMDLGNFTEALNILKNVKIENKILSSYAIGLIGDCNVELGRLKKGLTYYELAAKNDVNDLTTARFLFKAFLCAEELNELDRAYRYINTIANNFSDFAAENSIKKYLNDDVTEEFELPIVPDFYKGGEMGYGVVNGKRIDTYKFVERINKEQENAQQAQDQQSVQKGGMPGSIMAEPVDLTRVWNRYVIDFLIQKECGELKLKITPEEFDAYLFGENGFSVLPDIAQAFRDSETGMFNPRMLQARIDQLANSPDPYEQEQWKLSKQYYSELRLKMKHAAILKRGIYLTKLDLAKEVNNTNNVVDISFVQIPFSSIEDDVVPINNDLLRAYYNDHKNEGRYQNEIDSRRFLYFDIPIEPSRGDTLKFYEEFETLKKEFKETTNDSLFVMKHSENKIFIPKLVYRPRTEKSRISHQVITYPESLTEEIDKAKIGDIIGPYNDEETVKIAKILGFSRESMTVRHILISASRSDEEGVRKAKETAEKLMKEINHNNFEAYVKLYSEDHGSAEKGGVYSDFIEGEMVSEFNDYSLNEPIGKIGYVQTDFGFHIMEVLERKPIKFPKLAVVTKTFEISKESKGQEKARVQRIMVRIKSELEGLDEVSKMERFEKIAKEEGSISRPMICRDDRPSAIGFSDTLGAQVLMFMYHPARKIGDLAETIIADDERFIVGMTSLISKKNNPRYEDVRDFVKYDYIKSEKAKMIKEKFDVEGSLENIAAKNKLDLKFSEITMANGTIENAGFEPKVIGSVFQENSIGLIEDPIVGDMGVYDVRIEKKSSRVYPITAEEIKQQLIIIERDKMKTSIDKALVKRAQVINNTELLYLGVRM